jgi:kynurenine 3-monooxygenase
MRKRILVVGAGLAGSFMALLLARLGYPVEVYEKRSDPRLPGPRSGRAINLALSRSALQLLDREAGLGEQLSTISVSLRGRVLHSLTSGALFQPYVKDSADATVLNPAAGARSVPRHGLSALLAAAVSAQPGVRFHFHTRVIGCEPDEAALHLEDRRGRVSRISGEVIIAADGAFSAIRQQMVRRRRIRQQQWQLEHGYQELTIPARSQSRNSLRKQALHIWSRPGFLFMALPNADRSFAGGLFLPHRGKNGFANLRSFRSFERFLQENFPGPARLIPDLREQHARNPVNSLITVRCDPWHAGRAVLIGDACHTLYPFSGRGANLALEDCVALRNAIRQFAPDWERAFTVFTAERKPQTDYLSEATCVFSSLLLNALPEEGIAGAV